MPHKTNKLAAQAQQRWRDRKRALGLCIRCGKNPVKKDRSKCNRCLIIAANDQSEYTERLRRIRNSGGKLKFKGLDGSKTLLV